MKKEIKLGIFIVLILAISGYFIMKTESLLEVFSKGKRYPIYARFSSTAGMFPTAAVRLAGIEIGKVQNIRLEGRHALVRLLIDKKYTLTDDARALVSTIGIVGEKYVEIVYKEEFRKENPQVIPANGEILTMQPFDLNEVKVKIDMLYAKLYSITDSLDRIVSHPDTFQSIHGTLLNLRSTAVRLNELLAADGEVKTAFSRLNGTVDRFNHAIDDVDKLIVDFDSRLVDEKTGLMKDIRDITNGLTTVADDLRELTGNLKRGQGTAGRLLNEDGLYRKVDESLTTIQSIVKDLEKKKESINTIQTHVFAGAEYFPSPQHGRAALDLRLHMKQNRLLAGVQESPQADGKARFTLMAGRRFPFMTVSAGMFESQLGAGLQLHLWRDRLQFALFASRFHHSQLPDMKTVLSIGLSPYLRLSAGWYNPFRREDRQFVVGMEVGK